MKNLLSTFERVVLESLLIVPQSPDELSENTGLELRPIRQILSDLVGKGLISIEDSKFTLSDENKQRIKKINDKEKSIYQEFKEVTNETIKLALKKSPGSFKLKKVYLDNFEQKILLHMLDSVESFIKEMSSRKRKPNKKNETVVFWGSNQYQNILTSLMNGY